MYIDTNAVFQSCLQVLFASASDCVSFVFSDLFEPSDRVSFVFSDLFEPQMEEGQNQNLARHLTQGEITCIFHK